MLIADGMTAVEAARKNRRIIVDGKHTAGGTDKALKLLPVFDTVFEMNVLVERSGREYNQVRPHSALRYRPPAPEAIIP